MESVSEQNGTVQTWWQRRAAWVAVLGCMVSCGALTARAFTSADADTLFQAHAKAFYQEKDGRAWFKENTEGGKVSYWMRAEQMEMVLDAYERTTNQGTFVGAANLLGYTNEARLAATFTMNRLCRDGFLPAAGENGDGGGFNGIGVRWIARFMNEHGEQAAFEPWLQKNAEAAWQARRSSDTLSWCRWPQPTPEGRRHSWGCSSAVVILQVVRPTDASTPEKLH